MFGQGVGRQDGQRNGRIGVAGDRVGQFVGIDLAQGDSLAGRGARQAAGVGAGVGELQEVIVAGLVKPEHFLNLGLGLQKKILR